MNGYEKFGRFLVRVSQGNISERAIDNLVRKGVVDRCALKRKFRGIEYAAMGYKIVDENAFDNFFMNSRNC